MRKTKLIILPTKCLNQIGFLLLFLSCPVIGDWGRIRPDTEMSQWSIQIGREGSCGLVRNPSGIKEALTPAEEMECNVADSKFGNDTATGAGNGVAAAFPKVHEPRIDGRNFRNVRSLSGSERRINVLQREANERSFRRSVAERGFRRERRSVSLDRQRYDGSSRIHSRREERESGTYRRLSQSLERRTEGRRLSPERRVRVDGERVTNDARRSVSRIRREVNERTRDALRRNENIPSLRVTNSERFSERRNEKSVAEDRRVRYAAREARRSSSEERLTRRVTESPERRSVNEERVTRRIRTESRDSSQRRTERSVSERRADRRSLSLERKIQGRRVDNVEERRLATEGRRGVERTEKRRTSPDRAARRTERNIDRSNNERRMRTEDVRSAKRDERAVRDVNERRQDRGMNVRNMRSRSRNELTRTNERRVENREVSEARRIDAQSRREDMRLSIRRNGEQEDRAVRREVGGVMSRLRENRAKPERISERMGYDRLGSITMKHKKLEGPYEIKRWQLLDDIKTWFGQKNDETNWAGKYSDFTTTCLVGAAVYYLTTRQVKSV